MISVLCKGPSNLNTCSTERVKTQWEKDRGISISEEDWTKILDVNQLTEMDREMSGKIFESRPLRNLIMKANHLYVRARHYIFDIDLKND